MEFLKNSEGYISGEEISNKLGVSRASIWKHINALKDEGYEIESSPKKGYRLVNSADILNYEEIKRYLNTKYIGRTFYHFHHIDSTNTKAKELSRQGEIEGTVILSESQSAGRGRLGRVWCSPERKGIWFSIILRPDIDPVQASKITLIGAASVYKALESMGFRECKIKWPNDLIINNKKVCGILTEMSGELNKVNYIVMGIGLNVNIDQNDFPEELKHIATSLKIEKGEMIDRKKLLGEILNNLETYYDEFIHSNSIDTTIDICKKNSILLGSEIQCIDRNNIFNAKAIDINPEGELVIQLKDGSIKNIISGEVSIRGLYGYVE